MYKVCYVLTDNDKQVYFNEFMISVSSLRYQGFEGPVLLITDVKTSDILADRKDELSAFKVDMIAAETPENYSAMESSRFLKTGLRELVEGDYLFVDTDTVFAQNLPETISEADIAAVPDLHKLTIEKDTALFRHCKPMLKKIGVNDIEGRTYFNSGVMWVRDNKAAHEFYSRWHAVWLECLKKGIPYDQPAFNYVDWQSGGTIRRLADFYNVQVSSDAYFRFDFISKAYILHYFNEDADHGYPLAKKEVREQPYTSEEIQDIIHSPRAAFHNWRVVNEEEGMILSSASYHIVRGICRKHKTLFGIAEKISKTILNIRGK